MRLCHARLTLLVEFNQLHHLVVGAPVPRFMLHVGEGPDTWQIVNDEDMVIHKVAIQRRWPDTRTDVLVEVELHRRRDDDSGLHG